ncbi:GNAT family N-acetyltransferase [Salinivibrio kushneri]|uniref:GNAT family N-acetyltransferase n=1 Tax=Salinivibrio kushneri TaxID=1908198 RepID=UPI0009897021|nr:GNAT family N-acetyltransferase [Salinivibrio kushneri]OOE32203.1 GNAT family N-acetyltransferase [Salinivibrio kushneri]
MKIREATISDLEGTAILFNEYRIFYRQESDLESSLEFIRERMINGDSVILVASTQDGLVGFVQMYPSFSSVAMKRIYILNDLFVLPSSRRKGAANSLLKAAYNYGANKSAVRLVLATDTSNIEAQALYEKDGWIKNDRFIHYNKAIVA